MDRPDASEFAPYYNTYVSLIENKDVLDVLDAQPQKIRSLIGKIPEERGNFAYSEGKWTIKELLSHVIDGERIFAYRVLRISRGDQTPIEGFEQDDYIELSNAANRRIAEMIEEFELQRRSNMLMLRSLPAAAHVRLGWASGHQVSVRALTYIMAGHVIHHLNILRDRYLPR